MAVTFRHSDGIREVPRSLTSNQALVPFYASILMRWEETSRIQLEILGLNNHNKPLAIIMNIVGLCSTRLTHPQSFSTPVPFSSSYILISVQSLTYLHTDYSKHCYYTFFP